MDVEEFIGLKGAVPLLCELNEEGVRFTDLEDNLPVATSTFNIRREQALDLDLIKVVGKQQGTQGKHVYALTEKGERLKQNLDENSVIEAYQKHRLMQELYHDRTAAAREKISQDWDSRSQ